MPAAFELRGQECFHDVEGGTYTYDSCAETKDVRIVVLPCHSSAQWFAANHGAYERVAIRCDGHTDPRAANKDRELYVSVRYCKADCMGKVGVVARLERASTEVLGVGAALR